MSEEEPGPAGRHVQPLLLVAANDHALAGGVQTRFEAAVLILARLIGRQIAREEFAKRRAEAANDNSQDSINPNGDKT